LTLQYKREDLISFSFGAAQQNISQEEVKKLKIIIPDEKIALQFDQKVLPLFSQIETLTRQNALLRQTRDALLPRLLGGGLAVKA
jgi:type I restriction enzyme S subunit